MFLKKDASPNIWMNFSDLAIGSLIIFILITFVLALQVKMEAAEQTDSATEAEPTEDENFGELLVADYSGLEDITGVSISEDKSSIRLYAEPSSGESVFFKTNEFIIQPALKQKLNTVWPVFLREAKRGYRNESITIKELRIEGHTDSERVYSDKHGNLGLSQRRATETWLYINRELLSKDESTSAGFKKFFRQKVVAIGYGEQKLLNSNAKLILDAGGVENKDKSRRIELGIYFERANQPIR